MLNVTPEVYDIFEVTGFSELLEIHKKLREVSVEGCVLLGEGGNGKVYRFTTDEMLYLASQRIIKHWHARCQNWDLVLSQLELTFPQRLPMTR